MFTGVWIVIKSIFKGIRQLNSPIRLGAFLMTVAAAVLAVVYRDMIFSLALPAHLNIYAYWGITLSPALCLFLMGQALGGSQVKYKTVFENAGLVERNGNTPFLVGLRPEGRKKIYMFKSEIPLPEWIKRQPHLETGLNCNILLMREGRNNKKYTELITVPNNCRIPEKIDWSDAYTSEKDGVVVIGESALSRVEFDLNKTPHVLVAGETGSGKSVILRTIVRQMALRGCRIFMLDFKGGVEFGIDYERFGEVVMERELAVEILNRLVEENTKRLTLFRRLGVKNLAEYNKKTGSNLCRIAVVSDEIGEMLDKKGSSKQDKEVMEKLEKALSTLARLSRATGINLFLGVQRPDANVLTGQIKNNIPIRISGRFADKAASEIVLGNTDAVSLPEIRGRFLFKLGNTTTVFQAFYFDDATMLSDVHVEQGDMLIEGSEYKPPVPETAKMPSAKVPVVKKEEETFNFEFDDLPFDVGGEDY